MTGFKIDKFAGTAPRFKPRNLPPGFAQTAQNCNLQRGTLSPLKSGLFVWTPTKVGTIQSIYKFGGAFWFHWAGDVDVVQGPIANDTQERTYYTGDGVPKVTDASVATSGGGTDYPTVSYTLGLPAPAATPGTSLGAGGGCNEEDKVSVAFVYTYVTGWGEEGPPSAASAVVDVCAGQTVTVTGMSTAPAGAYNVTTKRIYAAVYGEYQYVGEVPVATTSYEITAFDASALGETLPSATWYAPPTDMHSITMLPNGIAAGLSGKTVCFSEPYLLHAWPTEYQLILDDDGVAMAACGQSVVVTTANNTYLISGVDPASMSMLKLEANQSCSSKRSMVDMGVFAIYASPDGLVAASPAGEITLVTEELLTREQWQAYNPPSIHAYYWEGQYVAFYDTGAVQGGFIFDPDAKDGLKSLNFYATAGFSDPAADALYLVVDGDIVQFDAGASLTYAWKSGRFVQPKPVNMGAAQVIADSYPVTFKVYADGVLKATKSVASSRGFRLPAGYQATDWEVELSGTAEVEEVIVVEAMRELAQA